MIGEFVFEPENTCLMWSFRGPCLRVDVMYILYGLEKLPSVISTTVYNCFTVHSWHTLFVLHHLEVCSINMCSVSFCRRLSYERS